MPEGVAGDALVDSGRLGRLGRLAHGALHDGFVKVMPAFFDPQCQRLEGRGPDPYRSCTTSFAGDATSPIICRFYERWNGASKPVA
jgi:hypothetical protein